LLVRPEDVVVRPGSVTGINCFAARIEAAVFQGSSFDLDLRLATGETLAAQVPAGTDGTANQEVTAAIDPSAAVGIVSSLSLP
jgi:hypothetical protein